jgi:hypothetical protein
MGCGHSRIKTIDNFWDELPIRKKKLEDIAKIFMTDDDLTQLPQIKSSEFWQFIIHPSLELESDFIFEELFIKCKMRPSYFFAVTSLLAIFYSGKEIATHFSIIDLKFPELITERHEGGGTIIQVFMKHPEIFKLYIELVSSLSIYILTPVAEQRDVFEKYAKCYSQEAIDIYSKRVTELVERDKEKFWNENYKMIQDDKFIREELRKISEGK